MNSPFALSPAARGAMSSPRGVLLVALAFGLAIAWPLLAQAYWPARWPLDVAEHAVGRDFVNVWTAGRLVLEGRSAALFDVHGYMAEQHRLFHPALAPHYWSYPPTNFFLAVPFGLLPYGPALLAWTVLGLAVLVWAACIGLDRTARRPVTLLVLLAPATLVNVVCGQNGFFTAALLAGGILLLASRPLIAGVLIGLISLKPHFAIVVVPALLALGAWRTLLAAGATAVLVAVLSVLAFGLDPWTGFVSVTMPNQGLMLSNFQGFFTTMLISPYAMLRHLGLAHAAAMGMQLVIAVLVIAAVMAAVRRTSDATQRLGLVAAGTFVATPYALTYDLPVIALVIARLAVGTEANPFGSTAGWSLREAAIFGAAWALPLASPMLTHFGLPLAAPMLGCLFLLLALPRLWPVAAK